MHKDDSIWVIFKFLLADPKHNVNECRNFVNHTSRMKLGFGQNPNTLPISTTFLPSLIFSSPIPLTFSQPQTTSSGSFPFSLFLSLWLLPWFIWYNCTMYYQWHKSLYLLRMSCSDLYKHWYPVLFPFSLKFFISCLLNVVSFMWCAGRKSLVFRTQNIDHKIEPILTHSIASEPNRNIMYPYIEPYSTGFLKVSDLHTIYWEQSGNPIGHVSTNSPL